MSSIFGTIAEIVVHTPLWVWGLYALLLYLGFQRTRDSVLPLWRILILPAVVTIVAIISGIGAGLGALPALLLGLAIGGAVGWRLERSGDTIRMPDGRLKVRGEGWSFGLLLIVLSFRYATAVAAAMNPALNADPTWHLGTLFISASLSGVFLGRVTARLRAYFAAVPLAAPG